MTSKPSGITIMNKYKVHKNSHKYKNGNENILFFRLLATGRLWLTPFCHNSG